jgi:hypothetical protein
MRENQGTALDAQLCWSASGSIGLDLSLHHHDITREDLSPLLVLVGPLGMPQPSFLHQNL